MLFYVSNIFLDYLEKELRFHSTKNKTNVEWRCRDDILSILEDINDLYAFLME